MTAFAFAAKCGFFGASGSLRGGLSSARAVSRFSREPSAMDPSPTAQSRKKCRRVRASVRASSGDRFMGLTGGSQEGGDGDNGEKYKVGQDEHHDDPAEKT